MSLFYLCTLGLCMESRLSSKKHGSSRFIARCPPRSHQLQVGKFSATLSPVYATIRNVFFGLLFSFTLSFSLILLPFSPCFLKLELSFSCPSPLIRTTTLHCSGESSRRLLPVTHSPDLLRDPGRGRRFSYRLTAPQIAFIGAFLTIIGKFSIIF